MKAVVTAALPKITQAINKKDKVNPKIVHSFKIEPLKRLDGKDSHYKYL